ncbi:MAG: hypothetical protein H7837_02260 [Magnetococcus sp. MYC-9]
MHFAPQRRLFLLQSLLLGLALGGGGCVPMPVRQGVHRLEGELRVDGQVAGPETLVRPGNTVTTGAAAQTVLVIGEDAFLLGGKTTVAFHPAPSSPPAPAAAPVASSAAVKAQGVMGFTLQTGRILSVFASGARTLKVPSAVIGVRGTGLFLQVEPERDYVCLCYGQAEIRMNDDPGMREFLQTRHHESPRFLAAGTPIREAPMLNHTDAELTMLEALVGRQPPFVDERFRY